MFAAIDCFHKAFEYLIKQKGRGGQKKLFQKTGIKPSVINDIYKRRTHGSEKTREKLANALGYTYEEMLSLGRWILEGKDPEEWERERTKRLGLGNISPGPDISGRVPLISWVQAGEWMEVEDMYQPGHADIWVETGRHVGPNAFALRVEGDSMEPEFLEGDIIVVDPAIHPESGYYVVAKLEETQEATLKQLRVDGAKILLVPKNSRYPIMDVTGLKFRIVGVVVEKIKRYL